MWLVKCHRLLSEKLLNDDGAYFVPTGDCHGKESRVAGIDLSWLCLAWYSSRGAQIIRVWVQVRAASKPHLSPSIAIGAPVRRPDLAYCVLVIQQKENFLKSRCGFCPSQQYSHIAEWNPTFPDKNPWPKKKLHLKKAERLLEPGVDLNVVSVSLPAWRLKSWPCQWPQCPCGHGYFKGIS